jgi:hypothetical protein
VIDAFILDLLLREVNRAITRMRPKSTEELYAILEDYASGEDGNLNKMKVSHKRNHISIEGICTLVHAPKVLKFQVREPIDFPRAQTPSCNAFLGQLSIFCCACATKMCNYVAHIGSCTIEL